MSFSTSDRKKVESVMSSVTTTVDGVGRTVRDLRLIKRLNPDWPVEVRNGLTDLESTLRTLLDTHSGWEGRMAEVLENLSPPATPEPV